MGGLREGGARSGGAGAGAGAAAASGALACSASAATARTGRRAGSRAAWNAWLRGRLAPHCSVWPKKDMWLWSMLRFSCLADCRELPSGAAGEHVVEGQPAAVQCTNCVEKICGRRGVWCICGEAFAHV